MSGNVLVVWNFCVKFFKLLIQQISLLQIYQLPNGGLKDGMTWTAEWTLKGMMPAPCSMVIKYILLNLFHKSF